MDAEFILVCYHTKGFMKQQELAEKWPFFLRVLKMGNFGQNTKGGPFAKFSILAAAVSLNLTFHFFWLERNVKEMNRALMG